MSWTRLYRLALYLLPAGLRRRHGSAMEALFARDLTRARARGLLIGAFAGAAGVWDVVRRAAYEQLRQSPVEGAERNSDHTADAWNLRAEPRLAADAGSRDPLVPQPTTRQLLRRHAATFAIAFVILTLSMLVLFVKAELPSLRIREALGVGVAQPLLLAVPFIAALTIPMAVFVAVLWEFTRLRTDGTLAAARRERDGVRRLILPVLGAAVGVSVLAFVVTAEVVPRANERLAVALGQRETAPTDRMMTISELRTAARTAHPEPKRVALARAAGYEVEVQKKFALPAACVVLTLAAIAIAFSVPRGRVGLVIAATCVTCGVYYVLLVAGESLANRLIVSPIVAMWGPNALLVATALLLAVWRRSTPLAPGRRRRIATSG